MMKKLIIMWIVFFGMMANCLIFAQDKPVLVLSSIRFNVDEVEGGQVLPQIAVNSDGTWRYATLEDVWAGQQFNLFDRTKTPILQGKAMVNSFEGDYYVGCDPMNNFSKGGYYWGIYKAKQQFELIGHGKVLKPQYVISKSAQKALIAPDKDIKERLQNGVREDWSNIQSQFPELHTSTIFNFMVGDINGDKKDDYILVLGDLENIKGVAAFIYLSNGIEFTMTPIGFWEDAGAGYSGSLPKLSFIMDFNGDGTKEIVIMDSTSDSDYPVIYGWFKDQQALMILYEGDELNHW